MKADIEITLEHGLTATFGALYMTNNSLDKKLKLKITIEEV